jgi:hypothetical protein
VAAASHETAVPQPPAPPIPPSSLASADPSAESGAARRPTSALGVRGRGGGGGGGRW